MRNTAQIEKSHSNQFSICIDNISASSLSTSGDVPSLRSFTTIASIGSFVLRKERQLAASTCNDIHSVYISLRW